VDRLRGECWFCRRDRICCAGKSARCRIRSLTGSFDQTETTGPRARLQPSDGRTTERHNKALLAYQRRAHCRSPLSLLSLLGALATSK